MSGQACRLFFPSAPSVNDANSPKWSSSAIHASQAIVFASVAFGLNAALEKSRRSALNEWDMLLISQHDKDVLNIRAVCPKLFSSWLLRVSLVPRTKWSRFRTRDTGLAVSRHHLIFSSGQRTEIYNKYSHCVCIMGQYLLLSFEEVKCGFWVTNIYNSPHEEKLKVEPRVRKPRVTWLWHHSSVQSVFISPVNIQLLSHLFLS